MLIYGIIDINENEYRLEVKATEAMNQGWLKALNEGCDIDERYNSFEEAINDPYECFLSNKDGFLVMEVVRNLDDDTYCIEYYFDNYVKIDAELTDEELEEIDKYIEKFNFGKYVEYLVNFIDEYDCDFVYEFNIPANFEYNQAISEIMILFEGACIRNNVNCKHINYIAKAEWVHDNLNE